MRRVRRARAALVRRLASAVASRCAVASQRVLGSRWASISCWGVASRWALTWLFTLAWLGLLVDARSALAEETVMPSAALQGYYQEERRFGAERSEALARALILEGRKQPVSRRLQLLEQASVADPLLVDPHLERAALLLGQGDLAAASLAVGDAAVNLISDAVQQAMWLRRASQAIHTLLLVTLGTLASLLLVRTLPFVRHLLVARGTVPVPAVLVGVVPVAAAYLVSPVVGVLVVLALLSAFLARRERRMLAGLCFVLALSEASVGLLMGPHAMLLDPDTASAKIALGNRAAWDPALEELVREAPPSRERDLVLGMLARRRGAFQSARAHYLSSLDADSTWATAYVNLANLFFQGGDYQHAAAGYRSAQTFAPESPYAYGNLARTYIEMMHFSESDQELRRAGELDYESITHRRRAWAHEDIPVVDVHLTAAELLRFARREAQENRAHAGLLLQAWRGRAWAGLPVSVSPWLLLAVGGLLVSHARLRSWAFECAGCARVVCKHCTDAPREAQRHLCPYCDVTAPRMFRETRDSADPRSLGRRAAERSGGTRSLVNPPRVAGRAPAWAAALFPGAADLARGAPLTAAFSALIAWGALFFAASLARAAAQGTQPWRDSLNIPLVGAATAIFVLAYVPGLVKLRQSRRRNGSGALAEGA